MKKTTLFASLEARKLFGQLSKAALLDMCYTLSQLDTNESDEQIITKMAREALIVLGERQDRIPTVFWSLAKRKIDGEDDE